MNCKKIPLLGYLFLLPLLANAQVTTSITIVPQPATAYSREGQFELKADTRIYFPEGKKDWETAAQYFMAVGQTSTGFQLVAQAFKNPIGSPRDNAIYFIPDESVEQPEGYKMEISPTYITVRASTAAGAFYAVQSLRQIFPTEFCSPKPVQGVAWQARCCTITDYPRFGYRGLHLDVSRHFFSVEFVKRYIDLLAMHKMNRFHWHLTDDQGWRIEIKKYPKLQTVASCRKETLIGHNSELPQKFDGKQHCGFYTQEEVKEIVKYAKQRFVTIVPEIEMPGHALAALSAYPELGCTGGPYEPATHWGVFEDVFCAGNDKTFEFVDGVLEEVCALFPGTYVHVGGDESPKDRWKVCPKCQKRIKDQGLKDEHELQSYFIKRAEKTLAKYGKKLIGWDEILEGGLAPTATVMSWRGIEGGIAAARSGHDAIMTPGSHCYLDYYQSDPGNEPLAIGGLLTLERVYGYEPIPDSLTEEQGRHILGAQGNVWTEYIDNPAYAEYMVFPRASALSEVMWTPKAKRNWPDFLRRIQVHFTRLDLLGVTYAKSIYDVKSSFSGGYVSLRCGVPGTQVKYTTDGTEPKGTSAGFYSPLPLQQTTTIKAVTTQKGVVLGKILTVRFFVHKASGKTYTMSNQPSQYSGGERYALTNGMAGALKSWNNWVGLQNSNIDPVIDLGAETDISRVTTHFINNKSAWIYPPRSIEVLVSDDGQNFRPVAKKTIDADNMQGNSLETVELSTPGAKARYLKLVAQNYGTIPPGVAGAGSGAWLFLDEVQVD